MRRVQIYLEEAQDDALQAEAARRETSKAALIREAVDAHLGETRDGLGPLHELVGDLDEEPGDIDEVVYGPRE